jgi:hypothetical protein
MRLLTLFILFLIAVSCSKTVYTVPIPPKTVETVQNINNSQTVVPITSANLINFVVLEQGLRSNYFNAVGQLDQPTLIRATNNNEYNKYYDKIGIHAVAPDVNFETDEVLIIVDKMRGSGGFSIFSDNIISSANVRELNVVHKVKVSNYNVQQLTQPYQIIATSAASSNVIMLIKEVNEL